MGPLKTLDNSEIRINKEYFWTIPAILKYFHIIIGFICVTSLYETPGEADRYFQDIGLDWYWLFGSFSNFVICFAYGSLVFLIASMLEWNFTGRYVMARINFIFHTTAATTLAAIELMMIYHFMQNLENLLALNLYIKSMVLIGIDATLYGYAAISAKRSNNNY